VRREHPAIGKELLACGLRRFGTILADPPWPFASSGKYAPDDPNRFHYDTLSLRQIAEMPVERLALSRAHLYLWVPNGLLAEGVEVMRRWGFAYRTNLVWCKVRRDGGIDGGGVGNFFRHAAEILLFGVRGSLRTRAPARRQPSVVLARRREHSRKPDEFYDVIESCSPPPRLELFARYPREGWYQWGNQIDRRLRTDFGVPGGPTTVVRTLRRRFVIYRPNRPRLTTRRETA
jgi:N6-adenosine-specific RNA methylase IME4